MLAEMQPLFWRIQNTDVATGLDDVSLLMPATDGEAATVVPTDVSFCSRRSGGNVVDVRWSDDDSDLFLSLLDRISLNEDEQDDDDSMVLDINDGVVQGIVQLVALARFKTPWPTDELLGDDLNIEREETEIGDLVALNTIYGFAMGIVVGMDSIDMTCVLLEDLCDGDLCVIPDHSVLVINRNSVLPVAFADADVGEGAIFH